VVLGEGAPAADQNLAELDLPQDSLLICIIRDGQMIVPRGDSRLQVADRLILITQPEAQEETLRILTGEGA